MVNSHINVLMWEMQGHLGRDFFGLYYTCLCPYSWQVDKPVHYVRALI